MKRYGLTLGVALTALLSTGADAALIPGGFIDCVQNRLSSFPAGQPSGTCALDSLSPGDVYVVSSEITVRRSNIIIKGLSTDRSRVVLRRASTALQYIMRMDSGLTNVSIIDVRFDGNRNLWPLDPYNTSGQYRNPPTVQEALNYIDLQLSGVLGTSTFLIQADFLNAPGNSLELAPGTTIQYSNFIGNHLSGVTSCCGATITGVTIFSTGFEHNGGSGASLANVANANVLFNAFRRNHREFPWRTCNGNQPCPGGEIHIAPDSAGVTVRRVSFDGEYVNGCYVGNCTTYTAGIEGYGPSHSALGNVAVNHTGAGISFADVTNLSIQPDAEGYANFVSGNGTSGFSGIEILNYFLCSSGVTVTGNISNSNTRYGLQIDANGHGSIFGITATNNTLNGNGWGPQYINAGSGTCP